MFKFKPYISKASLLESICLSIGQFKKKKSFFADMRLCTGDFSVPEKRGPADVLQRRSSLFVEVPIVSYRVCNIIYYKFTSGFFFFYLISGYSYA